VGKLVWEKTAVEPSTGHANAAANERLFIEFNSKKREIMN
jgi:hypothetical protein